MSPERSSLKKRKRRTQDDSQQTQPEEDSQVSILNRRNSSLVINGMMGQMDIAESQETGDGTSSAKSTKHQKRKLKRKLTAESNLVTSPTSAEHHDNKLPEETHGREKRRKAEPAPAREPPPPPAPSTTVATKEIDSMDLDEKKSKIKKKKSKGISSLANSPPPEPNVSTPQTASLTPMQKAMKDRLEGGRFRYINEVLYKSDSKASHQMMKDDPMIFEDYHAGFRRQVTSWPTNPVTHYISTLSSYSKNILIADLGCGEAALAKALIPKGFHVMSFDLVSDGEFIIEADICDRLPLPGTESGGGRIVDVVVCALSLMSSNWPQCMKEARRVLKDSGELKIAEVTSRFTDINAFISMVSSIGFQLIRQEQPTSHFTLFDFKVAAPSNPSPKEWKAVMKKGASLLKPCEYKRR
ncbi:25S rRNA (adenine645-N1)-methyltransferase [Tulasnella sp. 403]|nr:25S rRNA (adenine645-N1)-methyltransferase [Tulasnella sp. 403]